MLIVGFANAQAPSQSRSDLEKERAAIQKEIETPLARLLLKGDVRDGTNVNVEYDASHDTLRFNVT